PIHRPSMVSKDCVFGLESRVQSALNRRYGRCRFCAWICVFRIPAMFAAGPNVELSANSVTPTALGVPGSISAAVIAAFDDRGGLVRVSTKAPRSYVPAPIGAEKP